MISECAVRQSGAAPASRAHGSEAMSVAVYASGNVTVARNRRLTCDNSSWSRPARCLRGAPAHDSGFHPEPELRCEREGNGLVDQSQFFSERMRGELVH